MATVAQRGSAVDESEPLEAVEYTPEQAAALRKAGINPERRSVLRRAADGLGEEWAKIRAAIGDPDSRRPSPESRIFNG